jgi:hypothetical protein
MYELLHTSLVVQEIAIACSFNKQLKIGCSSPETGLDSRPKPLGQGIASTIARCRKRSVRFCAGSSGDLLPSSPPAEKATARQGSGRAVQHLRWGLVPLPGPRLFMLVRNQQCRLTELHKFCSVFYFLGDYASAANPTNASEGSLGPRGVAFPLGPAR